MKKFYNDLKFIPNTPKTYEVRYLENKEPSKLSKLASWLGMKTVDNCSYSGCHHRDKSFDVDISIQGCKWWARNPNYGTSLPGYWKESPTGSYYWRDDLWLNHIGHGYDADNLIGQNNLYTVNTTGAYAWEDNSFCQGTQNFIRECAKLHEQGYPINESRTLPSSTTKFTQWTIKTAAIATATALNPGFAAAVGGTTWGIFKAAEEFTDPSEYDRKILQSNSSFGGDMFKAGALGWVGSKAEGVAEGFRKANIPGNQKDFCGWGEITDKTVSKTSDYRSVKIAKEIGSSGMESLAEHQYNRANGKSCDSDCLFCSD